MQKTNLGDKYERKIMVNNFNIINLNENKIKQ